MAQAPLKLTPPAPRAKAPVAKARTAKPRRPVQARVAAAPPPPPPSQDNGHVMHGQDSIGLIALLPWWRASQAQAIRARFGELESPVLVAADNWLASPTPAPEGAATDAVALASSDEMSGVDVASADQVNELDLAAGQPPVDRSWLRGLLAMLGGALAAASTARFLFV